MKVENILSKKEQKINEFLIKLVLKYPYLEKDSEEIYIKIKDLETDNNKYLEKIIENEIFRKPIINYINCMIEELPNANVYISNLKVLTCGNSIAINIISQLENLIGNNVFSHCIFENTLEKEIYKYFSKEQIKSLDIALNKIVNLEKLNYYKLEQQKRQQITFLIYTNICIIQDIFTSYFEEQIQKKNTYEELKMLEFKLNNYIKAQIVLKDYENNKIYEIRYKLYEKLAKQESKLYKRTIFFRFKNILSKTKLLN